LCEHFGLKASHGVAQEELKDHWINVAFQREQRSSGYDISADELAMVGLVYKDGGEVDEMRFVCQGCDKVLSKFRCASHMVATHGVSSDDAKTWLTAKDGNLLKTVGRVRIQLSPNPAKAPR
jgi:hypothetical protein